MKKRVTALSVVLVILAACLAGCLSACSQVEWADVIRLNNVTYYSDLISDNVTQAELAPYAWTRQKLSGQVHSPRYRLQNGDAAFLEPNTQVYSIAGYDPTLRLAAQRDGKWYIYEASAGSPTPSPRPSSSSGLP